MKLLNVIVIFAINSRANADSSTVSDPQDNCPNFSGMIAPNTKLTSSIEHSTCQNPTSVTDLNTFVEASKSLSHHSSNAFTRLTFDQLRDYISDLSTAVIKQLPKALDNIKQQASDIQLRDLPSDAVGWIRAHPLQTANYAMWIGFSVSGCFPGLISRPILNTLGFSISGPRAGSIAAITQSKMSRVIAKGIFAHLQSAGMRGYGITAANVVARTGIAASGLITYISSSIKSGKAIMKGSVPQQAATEQSTDFTETF